MAGTAEGQLQGSRSDINPSYLLSGDAGTQGGGTLQSSDTDNLLRNYEDVFGPAARDIKLDTQRHKRHQRWHLPDAFPPSPPPPPPPRTFTEGPSPSRQSSVSSVAG